VKERTSTIPVLYGVIIALALGATALIFSLAIKDQSWLIPTVTGGIGLFLGTYSLSVARFSGNVNKTLLLTLAIAAIAMSAIGFLLGISAYE
jgi:hypothetical protein